MSDSLSIKVAKMEEHVRNLETKIDDLKTESTKQNSEIKSEIQNLGKRLDASAINAQAIKTLGGKLDDHQSQINKLRKYRWIMPTIVGVLSAVGSPLLIYLIIKAIEG